MRLARLLLMVVVWLAGPAHATPYTVVTLQRPHAVANDQFGFAVGAFDAYVLVGAPGENLGAGAAYLFDGKTGALVHEFRRADGVGDDRFGAALTGFGTRILIGAPGRDHNTGATYVYDLTIPDDPGRALGHSDGSLGDFFGAAVGHAAGAFLVGAPRYKTSVNTDRAGQVYRYDQNSPTPTFTLLRPTPKQQVEFGSSITSVGATIVIGAPYDNQGEGGPKNGGATYLFDATSGTPLATVLQPAPALNDKFGFAVAAFGDKFVVGAPRDGDQRTGQAFIYDPAAPNAPLYAFNKPGATRGDEFGNAVTAVGANILVGARGDDDIARDSGAAYLFDGAGNWLETFPNPSPKRDDHFAWSVAAVGRNFAVGAPGDDADGASSGAAYLYVDAIQDPEGSCDDDDVCTLDEGTQATGCGHLPIAGCCNGDAECDDGDRCNAVERCENHACVASDPGCSDGLDCTTDCSPAVGCIPPQAPPGFPGLLCWLGALRDAAKTSLPSARTFSTRLVNLSASTYQRGEVASGAPNRRALLVLKRVKQRLRRIDAVVKHVQHKKKLDAAVAGTLLGYSKNARATLPVLAASLH